MCATTRRGVDALDAAFAETVRRTGASIGALYLLAPDRSHLFLALLSGAPAEVAEPWARIPLNAPAPVAVALREERIVWIGSQEEMARSYPRTAAALPYPLTLAAAPVTGVRPWGALLLMWPAGRPQDMTRRERGHITARCRRLARLLEEAEALGAPPAPDEPPRVLAAESAGGAAGPALAAADFVERLPGGSCALDLEGRFTYLSSGACRLLGQEAAGCWAPYPGTPCPGSTTPPSRTATVPPSSAANPSSSPYAVRPTPHWTSTCIRTPAGSACGSCRAVPRIRPPPVLARPAGAPAQPRAGRLYQLTHLAASLTEVVGVQDVMDLIADQVMPAFGAQGMVLSTVDAGRLRITGHRDYPTETVERLDGLALDTRYTPAGRVLATGVPEFFPDREEMRCAYPEAAAISGKQAWAFLPLIVSGRPVGCCVLSYDRPHPFPAEDRAVLTSLAGLVAQALDRARLYDTKHDLAHGLQQALLPRTLPDVPGLRIAARYLPATRGMDIGGDFYDLIPLGATGAAAVIGDVQGHDVAAAALMGQVRTAVHAHAGLGTTPDRVLRGTNLLLTDLGADLFASALYARLDFAARRVALASAGHPPPVVRLPGEGGQAARPAAGTVAGHRPRGAVPGHGDPP
ncbi:SpoIIE family protein phosphatase [Streptomyces thermocoprophilus]